MSHSGGLVGLFKRKIDGESLVLSALMLTGMGAVLYYASERASDGPTAWFMAVIGCAAVFYCYKGSEISCHAWFQRRFVKFLGAFTMLIGAFTIETWNHLSVGSKNQDKLSVEQISLTSKREIAEANYNAALQTRKAREDRVKALEKAAAMNDGAVFSVNGATVTTPEAAQALIDKAKGHRFWGLTDGCKATKGPDTRAFCKEYAEAEAARSMAGERIRGREDFKAQLTAAVKAFESAEAEVRAAKAVLDNTQMTSGKERADTRNLKKVAAAFGAKDVDDNLLGSLLFVLGLTAFLSIRKWQMTAEEYEDAPRKPWGIVDALRSTWDPIKRALFGAPSLEDQAKAMLNRDGKVEFNETVTDAREVNELKARMRAAFEPKRLAA